MFGKKKSIKVRVVHYEGVKNIMQDFGCIIELKDNLFVINQIKPKVTVSLPIERVIAFDVMAETEFMKKYHNTNIGIQPIGKNFLVIRYMTENQEEKYLAFWTVHLSDYLKLLKLQQLQMNESPKSYSL